MAETLYFTVSLVNYFSNKHLNITKVYNEVRETFHQYMSLYFTLLAD